MIRDGILEISQLAEAIKTYFLTATEVREKAWFVRVVVIRQLYCPLLIRDGILEIIQFANTVEASSLGVAKVERYMGLSGCPSFVNSTALLCFAMALSRSANSPRRSKRILRLVPRLERRAGMLGCPSSVNSSTFVDSR